MAYTVIARRWRPKKFGDVVGQDHIVTTLKNSIRLGRVAQAYLFTGPRGVGKTSLARILAKAMNCLNGPAEEPCGTCENCLAIDDGHFVDIIELDAASKTGVDDMRDLLDSARYLPLKGRQKVYILDESHMLSKSAVAALLKTLEEPPRHSLFVLATTEFHKIPFTIMSRCQCFDFRRIPEKDIVGQLRRICDEEKVGYEETVLRYVASEADGSLRDAESILEQVIAYSGKTITEQSAVAVIGVIERDTLFGLVESIAAGRIDRGIALIDSLIEEGYEAQQVYRGLVVTLRNMLMAKLYNGAPPFLPLGEQEASALLGLAKDMEYFEIQNMLNYLLKAEDLLAGPFPKVSLEVLFINLYNLSRLRDVEKTIRALSKESPPAPPKPADAAPPATAKAVKESAALSKDERGLLVYLHEKKPFIAAIFENLNLALEEGRLVVCLDEKYQVLREDRALREEIAGLVSQFFERKMEVDFQYGKEKKGDLLLEYKREAELIFKKS